MSRTWKRFLSLLMAATLLLSLGVSGFAANDNAAEPAEAEQAFSSAVELPFQQVDNDTVPQDFPLANPAELEEEPLYADDDIVRVSIVLNDASALDAGYAPASAAGYRNGLKAQQDALANKISAEVLDGAELDVVWNITLAGNMMSANVPYGKIEAIRNVIGVRDVVLETLYLPCEDEVENASASEMSGAKAAWLLGYTGAGSKIAVIDTGLDTDHQSFDAAAFQYAIDEVNAERAETGEAAIVLMTENDVGAVWEQLNIAGRLGSADGVYRDAKVPFAANYVDSDLDVTHDNDTQGEHGSHVAGIAAANRYIPVDGGFEKALNMSSVLTQGEAPDAQLMIMKVFGKGGGAYDSDYMVAIEDAMVMGADAINLSLGSASAGFLTPSDTYLEILENLKENNSVVSISAGNNYYWADQTPYGYLYEDDINFHTGGSPGTYANAFTVASVDNKGMTGAPIVLSDGSNVFFMENNEYGNAPLSTLVGEQEYIFIDGYGTDEDFAALASVLAGKIAICSRGSTSFYQKANAAAANGAIGVIIYNNQAGSIGLNLTGYLYNAPVVSITRAEGALIKSLSEEKTLGDATYYTGKFTITDETNLVNTGIGTEPAFYTMSDFSSWGGNGGLTMKPEITAPGGNIWSVNGAVPGGKAYEIMSGTSMAAPQIAGLTAVLKQYIRDNNLVEKLGQNERFIAQSLLMSTAVPVLDSATGGYYYSILKQGAGLADVNNAITARALIQILSVPETAPASAAESIADGKVKVEVGEVKDGSFSTSFSVTNFSEEDMSLYLNGDFFSQYCMQGFRTNYALPIPAAILWAVNGEAYAPASLALDFNGDGVSNSVDAQTLLNWCADETTEIYNLEYADLDGDGNVDTADAKLAFEELNGAAVELAAGETAVIAATVYYDMSDYEDVNGNYIEGYLFVREGDTNDGALGVEHSIPVFGYHGSITDANMFDRGSVLEYTYGFGDGAEDAGIVPYLYVANGQNEMIEGFLVKYANDSNSYIFGGNPLISDETYMPERNAINGENGDMLYGVQFSLIRNAGNSRFYAVDKYGRTAVGSEFELGPITAAYYNRNQATWANTATTGKVNFIPRHVKEGTSLNFMFQAVPEYYVAPDGTTDWEAAGDGATLTIPAVIDNTAPDIVKVERLTTEAEPVEPDEGETEADTETGAASDTLMVTVHDNQYVAAVLLRNDKGDLISYSGAVQDTIRGKEVYYSFDLAQLFADSEDGVYPYLMVQVYDYAMNLSTWKINLEEDVSVAEVESVTVTPAEATVIGTGTTQLSADVRPWGIDDTVFWSSSDESVATVDDNGVVRGVAEGTATITAVSALNEEVYGSSEITVKFIEKELNGIVWDENGEVFFSDFNLKTLPAYTKLSENMRLPLAGTAYGADGTLYVSSFDSQDWVSTLYTVDEETFELTEIGPSEIGYMDICSAPSLGDNILLAVYGRYVVIVDATTGDYISAFDLSSYTNNNYLVGIAYEEPYYNSRYGAYVDYVWLVDEGGNIYEMGIMPYNGSYANFRPATVGPVGYTTDTRYFSSLYYDGVSLYWSRFNANAQDIIMVDDIYNDGSVYQAGFFADNVWPAAGLYESGVNPCYGFDSAVSPASREEDVLDTSTPYLTHIEPLVDRSVEESVPVEEPIEEPVAPEAPVETEEPAENVGGLTGVKDLGGDADVEKIDTEVTVYIKADELTNNGKIVIDYDPATATLLSVLPSVQYKGVLDQTERLGHYVLAYVDLDGIKADGVILTLKFAEGSTGTVSITTEELNSEDEMGKEELVFLGSTEVALDHEHVWGEPVWTWYTDGETPTATATFKCGEDGASRTLEAVITLETTPAACEESGENVFTATVEFNGETFTDTYTVELEALGHDWGEPTWEWDGTAAATATFVCKRDSEHVKAIEAELSHEFADGALLYTATVEFEGETYTDTKTAPIPVQVKSTAMDVGEKFTLNLYLALSDELLADENATLTLNDVTYKLSEGSRRVSGGETRYGFRYSLAPKTFNDEIVARVFDGKGNAVVILDRDNNDVTETGYVYTAQQYIDKALAAYTEGDLRNLFEALNDFGSYAQTYFKYNTENIAETLCDLSVVSADQLADYQPVIQIIDESKLSYGGTALVLDDSIVVRQYVKLAEGVAAEDLVFTVNGEEVTPALRAGRYYVQTGNISAVEFDTPVVFQILDKDGNVLYNSEYSVFSYVNSALNKEGMNEDLLNLLKAMVLYNQSAKAYFG